MDWQPTTIGAAMATSEWVLATLTAVLVLATIYYAWQTHRMVREMRAAREVQVRPKVILGIRILGPSDFYPKVVNAGAGPALDLRAAIALEPDGPSAEYASAFMTPGRDQGIILASESGRMTHIDEYRPFSTLRMTGECSDVLGNTFTFDETFDLTNFLDGFKSGMWARLPTVRKEGEPLELIAEAVVNIENLLWTEG
jgi:hypothetical protein